MAKILKNFATGEVFKDSLHVKAKEKIKPITCTKDACFGSSMSMFNLASKGTFHKDELQKKARDFVFEYYEQQKADQGVITARLEVISQEIRSTGTYHLTTEELAHGARLAWRNAPRCPGRIQWHNLMLFDRRESVRTADQAFHALLEHISRSTNHGKIKPAITVFAQRRQGQKDVIRVWNKQLLAYAAYVKNDGQVVGDRGNLEFTQFCESLGWKGRGGRFDILPLVISDERGEPQVFDIPKEYIHIVKIRHPSIPEITGLNLEWFALPAVSAMCFDIAGLQFPAAPFSGWYSLPEIATRDLLDKQRYDFGKTIARALGLDSDSSSSFWLDRVNLEMNTAVLHSFVEDGVSIVDHHSQAEQFMVHFRDEHKIRGGCPADWVWIVPPESSSLTPVFHQEMLNYQLSPSYDYQAELHVEFMKSRRPKTVQKVSLKTLSLAVLFARFLYRKVLQERRPTVIFYGTETGTSKRYARQLADKMNALYNVSVDNLANCSMEVLDQALTSNSIVLFVTSTFGNGDPPTSGKELALLLRSRAQKDTLKGLEYAVLGLGSSSYPKFCAFGKFLDSSLSSLGGHRICPLGTCDEMKQPFTSFKTWTKCLLSALGHERESEDNSISPQAQSTPLAMAMDWLTRIYDVTSPPSQSVLSAISPHVHGNEEKRRLDALLSDEAAYTRWRSNYTGGVLALWSHFPSLKLSVCQLMAALDFLKPRWYSIANAPYESEGLTVFDLVWTVVRYSTPDGGQKTGLCTNYFMQQKVGSYVTFVAKRSTTFDHILANRGKPLILICVGSGIASVRGLWASLQQQKQAVSKGRTILFYGCRSKGDDPFQIETAKLLRRYTALSREPGVKRTYVQELVLDHAQEIATMLYYGGGSVVVSGPISMAEPVRLALQSSLMTFCDMDQSRSEKYLERLKLDGRLVEEIFGGTG